MKGPKSGNRVGDALPSEAKPFVEQDEDEGTDPSTISEGEAEGHLSDLLRAEKIKQDPGKMLAVHKLAGRHAKAIASIQTMEPEDSLKGKGVPSAKPKSVKDLNKLYNKKFGKSSY